ncbi:hypothetical protein K438DRAFT_1967324 [Mycena galopus ATCC 62051]|nr:hypothetical protein K438DRAFT_1967324 [Mycena galopus ATCC 62051]
MPAKHLAFYHFHLASPPVSMIQCRVPVEIERYIFELAAFAYPGSIPVFLLVAQRVKIWLEPLLYRVLSIYQEYSNKGGRYPIPLQAVVNRIELRPASFFHAHVRHVALILPKNGLPRPIQKLATRIFPACDATVDLVLFFGPTPAFLSVIARSPLRRLTLSPLWLVSRPSDFSHTAFSRITHLHWLDTLDTERNLLAGVELISQLTHLSVVGSSLTTEVTCGTVLAQSKSLQVFAIVCEYLWKVKQFVNSHVALAADGRFVVVLVSNDIDT